LTCKAVIGGNQKVHLRTHHSSHSTGKSKGEKEGKSVKKEE